MVRITKEIPENEIRIILFSLSALVVGFFIYSKITNPQLNDIIMLTPELMNLSIGVLLITFISSIAICFGIWKIYIYNRRENKNLSYYISLPFSNKKYTIVMILSGIMYGIAFSFLSQIFVYTNYDIKENGNSNIIIPSIKVVPCCNTMGYVPMIYIYLTEHFFILLIPINVVLVMVVSMLVGFNIALYTFIIKKIREYGQRSQLLGSIGATCGLFIGCPTCAGGLITALFGFSTGPAATTISLLPSFQTIFILISIPALVLSPFLIAKNLKKVL